MKVRDASGTSRHGWNGFRRPWACSLRHRCCFSYAQLISQHPLLLCLAIVVCVIASGLSAFLLYDLPDFSDPVAGFEPRGTTISQRSVTWQNILDQTGASQLLSVYPAHGGRHPSSRTEGPPLLLPPSTLPNVSTIASVSTTSLPVTPGTAESSSVGDGLGGAASGVDDSDSSSSSEWQELYDGELASGYEDVNESFFCFNPSREYARIVFEPVHSSNLFTLRGLQSMCQLEKGSVRQHLQFMRSCYTNRAGDCCRSWSLGNYVALLSNRSSCAEITADDVAATRELLQKCAHFYRSRSLRPDCWEARDWRPCPSNIHRDCIRQDAVYSVLHYLADVEFLSVEKPNNVHVRNAMVILPVHAGNDLRPIYEDNFRDKDVEDSEVRVSGLFFNLKYDLFEEYLTAEALYPCLGVVIIILLMWMYIGSLFITVMTVLSMAMSLILAYFFYRVIFGIPFFPFMNLTTVILLVGIGADDAFVYCDIWKRTRRDHVNSPHVLVVLDTLRHAAVSMFVTSLTTASAFFANTISSITSIKCFGVFAGTTILINCFFTVTWLPAIVTLYDHYFDSFCSFRRDTREYRTYRCKHLWYTRIICCMHKISYSVSEWSRIFFDKILPCVVVKLRYMWLLTLSTLTLGGFILIFLNPKLQLPTLPEFQLFRSLHPFERYDFVYKEMFWFEKVNSTGSQGYAHLPLTIVWGILPKDSGSPLDPDNRGTITFDETFDVALPDSQQWLVKFCARLRNHTYYFPTSGLQFKNCFIESFRTWMQTRSCLDPETGEDHRPCCQESTFPYPQEVFKKCLKEAVRILYYKYPMAFLKNTPGPRFSGPEDKIVAAIVEFDSTQTFTYSFENIKTFWTRFEEWVTSEMREAPPAMRQGWFTSSLDFYDLQDNLAHGTPIALGMSIIISSCVMCVTTQNFLISLYAILSISGTICVTIGALVLLGWQLNILESVILSVAVGLSVDFTVHYGVAYRIAPEKDRESRVVFSLGRMGSAITMAALTTFVAGALMMPSSVLSYTQMGTFLMLIMAISWVFSTFYFQSLCRTIGPEGSLGQFPLLGKSCCARRKNTVRAAEDSEAIHSHSSEVASSAESHELEPLSSFAASDLSSAAPSTSSLGTCSKFPRHLKVAPHCPHHAARPRPDRPLVPVSSRPAHSEVIWEGTGGFVTRLYQPVPQSESSSAVILPNRNPNIPDIWVKM
ncbi:protein dispatched homolog 1-like [Acanthaster planci]|uniref:Protein dispatched homolog 1-like n=1 Tax=Acanthaster planci TaxID=133434 RepID=A0A8B7Z6P1_ACAPL|nr:protein dispatched homolog 1-like [Acanthaster planci]XP_022101308.1 protein dispatched homolog 1-like [Acanthaster planci]XP_022101309.1 protein dispatched homolog 1-like [Acanthaster planci]